jgi:hypothetical protein
MIADSDWCGHFDMDTELITPSIDCSAYSTVTLEFDHYFDLYSGGGNEKGDVDIWDGSTWHNKARYQSDTDGHVTIDISDVAAFKSDVKIRWHYYDANFDWYWEVDNVELSGVRSGPPLPHHVKYLHCKDGLFNLTAPVDTQWHELWPFFCKQYHLSSWNDTSGDGILSYCDWIEVYEKPDGEVQWYHVENVTITLYVTPAENYFVESGLDSPQSSSLGARQPMYIEHEGGYDPAVLTAPYSTYWHEIYPNFCTRYYLLDWGDSNSTDTLNPCDFILLGKEDFDSLYLEDVVGEVIDNHVGTTWHVEEVAIDIIVTPGPPPVGGEAYPVSKASLLAPWIVVGVLLAGGIAWYVLRRRRAQS